MNKSILMSVLSLLACAAPFAASAQQSAQPPPLRKIEMERLAVPSPAAGEVLGIHPQVNARWVVAGSVRVEDGKPRGRVHLWHREGERWSHHGHLDAPATSADGDFFGRTNELVGDLLFVSDTSAMVDRVRAGVVYVYRWSSGRWTLEDTLAPAQPRADIGFGGSIASRGDLVAVGEAGGLLGSGWGDGKRIHLFRAVSGSWKQAGYIDRPEHLTPSQALQDKALKETGMQRHSGFGGHLAFSNDRLIVGAMGVGSVLVYKPSKGDWSLEQIIVEPAEDIAFGRTVAAIGGDILIAGLRSDTPATRDAGAAFVYRQTPGRQWENAQTLHDPAGQTLDMFGHWVSGWGDFAVVGAHMKRPSDLHGRSGGLYVFRKRGSEWAMDAEWHPDPASGIRLAAYALDADEGFIASSTGDELFVGGSEAGRNGGVYVGRVL